MARRHIMESTFRLNLLNPQHAKINEVIKGLNPKIYKSKNQFLIEACEFYIDHYGEDDIPSKEEKRYEQFVTRDEIEKIKKEIEYSAMSEAIPLLDHIIVGGDNRAFFSFKEKGMIDNPRITLSTDYRNLDIKSPLVAEQGKAR